MDYSLLAAAGSAIVSAKELGKAVLGVRDFNESALKIAEIQSLLLKAQESLFAHLAQLNSFQQEQFEMAARLREMEERLAERGRYSLVEISDRTFVLGLKQTEELAAGSLAHSDEPNHYICQPCFAKGIKSVLQKHSFHGAVSLDCSICKEQFNTGKVEAS